MTAQPPAVPGDQRGWLAWYAVPETSIPYDRLVRAAEESSFPRECLPRPLDRKAAWEQAFSLPEAGREVRPSDALRQRCPDPGLSCRLHVRTVRRRMPLIRHLELEVVCPGAVTPGEQRRTALVAVLRLDDKGHSCSTVIGPWMELVDGDDVARAVRRMEEDYRRLLDAAPPGASREAIRRRLKELSAILLRATGALYYIPHAACPDGRELMACRDFLARSSGGQFTFVRLLASDAQAVADVRAAVVETLRRQLAAIHDEAGRLKEVADPERRERLAARLLTAFQEAAETTRRVQASLKDALQELDDLLALAKGALAAV